MEGTTGALFADLLVSCVGFGLFLYGKKQGGVPQLLGGAAMMGFPYFVSGVLPVLGIGALLLVGVWLATRA